MKFLPTKITDSFTGKSEICSYYELGPKDYEGHYRVNFYYSRSFAITTRFNSEASRDNFLRSLILDPRSTKDSLQDYINWAAGKMPRLSQNNLDKYLIENNLEYSYPDELFITNKAISFVRQTFPNK